MLTQSRAKISLKRGDRLATQASVSLLVKGGGGLVTPVFPWVRELEPQPVLWQSPPPTLGPWEALATLKP